MKTMYYSETLNKNFETEKECLDAEKDHEEKLALVKAEREKKLELEKQKKEERKARADEVTQAFKDADEARKHAYELMNAFVKDYGAFHTSFTTNDLVPTRSLFDVFFGDHFFDLF